LDALDDGNQAAAKIVALLHVLCDLNVRRGSEGALLLRNDDFISQKLTTKLRHQTVDPLLLASRALPAWSERLLRDCPVLFPFEARQQLFSCTAFGVSRAIFWVQHRVRLSFLLVVQASVLIYALVHKPLTLVYTAAGSGAGEAKQQ